jgi:deoxyribodipyrimidine photolyase-like uncharacterized protein
LNSSVAFFALPSAALFPIPKKFLTDVTDILEISLPPRQWFRSCDQLDQIEIQERLFTMECLEVSETLQKSVERLSLQEFEKITVLSEVSSVSMREWIGTKGGFWKRIRFYRRQRSRTHFLVSEKGHPHLGGDKGKAWQKPKMAEE